MMRSFHFLVAIAAAVLSSSLSASDGDVCEIHVWALESFETQAELLGGEIRPSSPSTGFLTKQTPFDYSSTRAEIMDARQRLREMSPELIREHLKLDEHVPIFIHSDKFISYELRNSKKPVTSTEGHCRYDWLIRITAYLPWTQGSGSVFFREKHGQMYARSYFRAFDQNGRLIQKVNGEHRGRLPVIQEIQDENLDMWSRYIYDIPEASRQFVEHAAEKILRKIDFKK